MRKVICIVVLVGLVGLCRSSAQAQSSTAFNMDASIKEVDQKLRSRIGVHGGIVLYTDTPNPVQIGHFDTVANDYVTVPRGVVVEYNLAITTGIKGVARVWVAFKADPSLNISQQDLDDIGPHQIIADTMWFECVRDKNYPNWRVRIPSRFHDVSGNEAIFRVHHHDNHIKYQFLIISLGWGKDGTFTHDMMFDVQDTPGMDLKQMSPAEILPLCHGFRAASASIDTVNLLLEMQKRLVEKQDQLQQANEAIKTAGSSQQDKDSIKQYETNQQILLEQRIKLGEEIVRLRSGLDSAVQQSKQFAELAQKAVQDRKAAETKLAEITREPAKQCQPEINVLVSWQKKDNSPEIRIDNPARYVICDRLKVVYEITGNQLVDQTHVKVTNGGDIVHTWDCQLKPGEVNTYNVPWNVLHLDEWYQITIWGTTASGKSTSVQQFQITRRVK